MSDSAKEVIREPNSSGSKKTIYFIVLGILVCLLVIKVFLDQKEKSELTEYYQTEMEVSQQKLDKISEELAQKIHDIDSLGGDITELLATQEELEKERKQLQATRKANRQLIGRLRRKTDGYQELLKEKDKEIAQLTKLSEELLAENTNLKEDKNELNRSIVSLNENKKQLEDKVAVASRLKVEGIHIYAVAKNGKERESSFKNRQLAQLKVVFHIAKNDVAPLEGKEIIIRIIDENGQVVFDINKGSGSFMLDGKETFYTASKDVLFDNSNQQLSFVYDKGSDYDAGVYKMEVFTDGYLMGAETFTVK
ncbi:MAG: chromosome segregation protein SMC [Cyclobacteriaceae bacterium]|nr:chromosome segregation protein SMC [Cyclobacteriaceae bacterium]